MSLRWYDRRASWRDMQRMHGFRRGVTNRKWFWVLLGAVFGYVLHVTFAWAGY